MNAVNSYFEGKTIWITGASSGIGEQIVLQLSALGASLIISSRKKEDLERIKIQCALPDRVTIVAFDLADQDAVKRAAVEVLASHPGIDILFNNGGLSQRAEAIKTSIDLVRKIFDVNFFSNVLLSQLVAERMIANKKGHIVITSSLLGKWGFYLRSSYAATKHALHGYYESMRMEIEKSGVDISIVTPGFIATDISKHAMNEKGSATNEMDNNQETGLSAAECARRILTGVAARKKEFAVGGKELLGLKMKRFFPTMFDGILRKRSAK